MAKNNPLDVKLSVYQDATFLGDFDPLLIVYTRAKCSCSAYNNTATRHETARQCRLDKTMISRCLEILSRQNRARKDRHCAAAL